MQMMNDEILYFDAAATVPMLPEVVEAITNEMNTTWGNPSSAHILGRQARERMDWARGVVAEYIGCEPDEIIFTSSASAANNLAIRGYGPNFPVTRILTTKGEHKSILQTCQYLQDSKEGIYCCIRLKPNGTIDYRDLEDWLDAYSAAIPVLVTISMASSEIGTIQDIPYIADLVHMYKGVLHIDATQCFTKMPIDISGIDMMTVGGSKIGAGKGIGVLYKKKDIELSPLIYGGGQEQGLIAGTEDIPKMVGLATAVKSITYHDMDGFRSYFIEELAKNLKTEFIINGHPERHLDNLISISFKGQHAEDIVTACSELGLCISAGSACSSGNPEPSIALQAIGVPEDFINGTIRISMLQGTTREQIDRAVQILKYVVDDEW